MSGEKMENNYLDIEIKRDYSNKPKGFRHYSTDELFENTLVEAECILHKLVLMMKGENYEENIQNGAETKEAPKEVR